MKISVVITTYNRRASLERCLKSLAEQAYPPDEYEVVVVADGCSDGTYEFLRNYHPKHALCLVVQDNKGQPAAQNAGIAAASGELVILMDDDCICDSGLIAAHRAVHEGGDQVVAIGAVLPHQDTPGGTPGDLKRELEWAEYERLKAGGARRSDLMLCANSSIRRQAALRVRFDSSYSRMHDVEAGLRLWQMGLRPKFASDAVAYELFTKDVNDILRDAHYQGRYEISLTETHPQFKPLTSLVRINEGDQIKRWIRKQLAIHAGVSEFILKIAYGVSESLRDISWFRLFARRVLRARIGLQHVRGAVEHAGSWREVERRFGRRTTAVIYHNVGRPRATEYPGLTTPSDEFEAQMELLSDMGYQTVSPRDWLRWRDEGGDLPEKPLMLVFDDAYEEAAAVGFPILQRYGFSAACMVVTGCIGATNRWDEKAGRPSFRIMSAEDIVGWARNGIEFGGHTKTHPELPSETEERVEEEVRTCKDDLGELLGQAPRSFAYPFGAFDARARAAVARHFALGFTSWPGRLHLGTNPALVPRIAFLPGESKAGMWCRLRFGRNPFEAARNRWGNWFIRRKNG
jgi:glycosyltransferase involved in cell wall biosynthesis/peptidoglycan/xylan/chitin deacetylase (PgdA/CDA1 family)